MSMDLNRATFIGNVGKDPEVRVLPSGMVVANFSLATNKRVKDGSGGYLERPEWHNIVALDRTAEIARDYVHKGTRLYVEGEQQTRSWDDKASGERKYRTEVLVGRLILLSSNGNGNGNGNSGVHSNGNQRSTPSADGYDNYEYVGANGSDPDLDIPF